MSRGRAPAGPVDIQRAIVLGHTDYGDADRIVQLITAEQGRIAALAKGARRKNKRFTGALETGNCVEATLRRGGGDLQRLQGAELVHGHPHLREHLESIALAALLCEWVRELGRRDQPEPKLFGLLEVALLVLDACTEPPQAAFRMAFEAKVLSFAGLTPALACCACCGQALDGAVGWSPSSGGAVHEHCASGESISVSWAHELEALRRTPLAELVDTPAPQGGSPWALCQLFTWHHHGKPLRSVSLLQSLHSMG